MITTRELLTNGVLAWLGTYLVHSTLLLGAAWFATRVMRHRAIAWQEALWRVAVFGALVTATAQLAAGWSPWAIDLRPAVAPATADIRDPAPVDAATPSRPPSPSLSPTSFDVPAQVLPVEAASLRAEMAQATKPWRFVDVALTLWAGLALVGLGRLAAAHAELRRVVRSADPADDPELVDDANAACRRAGLARAPRLLVGDEPGMPFAAGVRRPVVWVPRSIVHDFDRKERRALLAHEIAHVARRDPAWRIATSLLVALVPLQPLLRVGRRRLGQLAEWLADDGASTDDGGGRALARCLVEVAAGPDARRRALLATPMSASSDVGRRVERLLSGTRARTPRRWRRTAVAGVILLAVGLGAPGLGASPAPEPPPPPEAPPAAVVPPRAEPPEAGAPPVPAEAPEPPAPPTGLALREVDDAGIELVERIVKLVRAHDEHVEALRRAEESGDEQAMKGARAKAESSLAELRAAARRIVDVRADARAEREHVLEAKRRALAQLQREQQQQIAAQNDDLFRSMQLEFEAERSEILSRIEALAERQESASRALEQAVATGDDDRIHAARAEVEAARIVLHHAEMQLAELQRSQEAMLKMHVEDEQRARELHARRAEQAVRVDELTRDLAEERRRSAELEAKLDELAARLAELESRQRNTEREER